jgi:hypothetical protein
MIPSLSARPSSQPSSISERYFQINSLFEEFDQTSKWCVTDFDGSIGSTSKMVMRPCKSRSHHQVMFQNEWDELQFIQGPTNAVNPKCIISESGSTVYVKSCERSATVADTHKWNITDTNDNGSIRQVKSGNTFLLGFDTTRKFSRLRLYKEGSFNTALYNWKLRYGYNVDKYDAPFYGNVLYLQNLGVPSSTLSDKSYLSDVDVSDVNINGSPSILRGKVFIKEGVENYKFEWIIRSKRVEVFDSSSAIDPSYGNCVKYGESIYLQGNQRAAVFLKKDGTVVQIPGSSSTEEFKWTVRSTSTGSDTDDPKNGICMAANDAIYLKNINLYLQSNAGLTVGVDSAGDNDYTKWSAQRQPFSRLSFALTCNGDSACYDADNTTIGDGGCFGSKSCYNADDTTIGDGGCVGLESCRDADDTTIGDGGCVGDYACNDANFTTIGDGGCVGDYACDGPGDDSNTFSIIGDGGCVGDYACHHVSNTTIGDESCIGDYACDRALDINIGKESCNCDGCCKECVGNVPADSCNTGGDEDDFDVDEYCKYC